MSYELKVPLFICLWAKDFIYTSIYVSINKSFVPQKNTTLSLKKRNKVFLREDIVPITAFAEYVLLIGYGEKDNNEVVKLPQPILSFLSLLRIFGRGKKETL